MAAPEINDFYIETKEDSAAKLAEANGKPTKFYLFATEFNSIKAQFAHLKLKILLAWQMSLADITANGADTPHEISVSAPDTSTGVSLHPAGHIYIKSNALIQGAAVIMADYVDHSDGDVHFQLPAKSLGVYTLATVDMIPTVNDRWKGNFTTLAQLQAAYPTANAGDTATIDPGSGSPARTWNWDVQDGWVAGSTTSAANTDQLPEGSTNLYFTQNRVLTTLLNGIDFLSATAITAGDNIVKAFGKLQAQIDKLTTDKESTDNKVTTFTGNLTSVTKFPVVKAIVDYIDTLFPSWQDYTTTVTGFNGPLSTNIFRTLYNSKSKSLKVNISLIGTSNLGSFTFTIPYNAKYTHSGVCRVLSNGGPLFGRFETTAGSNVINVYASAGSQTFITSGNKGINLLTTLEVE